MNSPKFFIGDNVLRTRRLRSRTVLKITRANGTFCYQLLAPGDRKEICWEEELRRGEHPSSR